MHWQHDDPAWPADEHPLAAARGCLVGTVTGLGLWLMLFGWLFAIGWLIGSNPTT